MARASIAMVGCAATIGGTVYINGAPYNGMVTLTVDSPSGKMHYLARAGQEGSFAFNNVAEGYAELRYDSDDESQPISFETAPAEHISRDFNFE